MNTEFVDADFLFFVVLDACPVPEVQRGRFLHVVLDGLIQELGDERGLAALLFADEDNRLLLREA